MSSKFPTTVQLAMASFGNDVERWNLKDVGSLTELLHPLGSVHYGNSLSPVKSISSIDHLLNLPGKADSAYSSFSGGSTIPEYHTSSFYNENCVLPSEQLSYMDAGFVRAVYNPSEINSGFRDSGEAKLMDNGSQNNSERTDVCGQYGKFPIHDFEHKSISPVSPSQSSLPHPPSPPARLESYKTFKTFDGTKRCSYTVDLMCQNIVQSPHNNNHGITSAPEPKPHRNSRQKNERLSEDSKDLNLSKDMEKKDNQHIFTRPSSFSLQECFKLDSMSKIPKHYCAPNSVQDYKISEDMNAKFSSPSLTSHVKDIHEKKEYLCATNVHKQPSRGADLRSHLPEGREPEVSFSINHRHIWFDKHATQDENVTQDIKLSNSSLQNESVSETKNCSPMRKAGSDPLPRSSEEKRRKDPQELSLTQRSKAWRSSQPCNPGGTKAGVANDGEPTFRNKAQEIFYCGPKNDLALESANVFKYEMQTNDSNMNQKQDVPANVASHEAPQLEFQKPRSSPVCDLTSDKINKTTTPMLYHLAGGRYTNAATILNCKNRTEPTKDPGNIPKKTQKSNHLLTEQSFEIQQKTKVPPKHKHLQQLADKNFENPSDDDGRLGSSGSSLDDSFMKDYREKIKVAQKKVLRETSFKRKDLQMSLPIRLKPNPSKRPSIEHFRSFSANEDIGFIPPSELWETSNKNEDAKKSQVSRIGGRKRATKEQKKLCYSEPGKLDQLGMQQTHSSLCNLESSRVVPEEKNASRRTPLERDQAWSTSNLSKTELKQLQHNAVVQYIERKTSLRQIGTPQILLASPMQRPSTGTRYSEWICSPGIEAFSQLQYSGRSPEALNDTRTSGTDRSSAGTSLAGSVQSRTQPLVREMDQSSLGPCPSADNLYHCQDLASSQSRERSKLTPPAQGCSRSPARVASTPNGKDHLVITSGAPNEAAAAEGISGVATEKLRAQTTTVKGKSMEEIEISEASQSTDQLHHMKGPGLLPGPGHELGLKNNSAAVCQGNLLQSLENVSGNVPKQMTAEGLMELPAGKRMTVPHIKSQGVFAHTEVTPSSPSPESPPAHQPLSLAGSTDAFLKETLTNAEDVICHTIKPPSKRERAAYSPLPVAPEEVQSEAGQETSLHDPAEHEGHLGDGDKIYQEFCNVLSSHSFSGVQPTFETTMQSPREDNRDHELEREKTNPSVSKNVVRNPPEFTGIENVTFSLDNIMELVQSDQDKNRTNCGSLKVKLKENDDNPDVSEKATDISQVKPKSPEDQRSEELANEIVARDKSLVDLLEFHPIRKTALDLMEGLFPVDLPAMDRSGRMRGTRTGSSMQKAKENDRDGPMEFSSKSVILPEKYQTQDTSRERSQELDDITVKKMELISNIKSKVRHLWEERELLLSDIQENASLGQELEAVVKAVCKPNEYERYLMFIGDLEKVVILLLCLSVRLARVQNLMSKMSDLTDIEERQSLNERHKLLSRQREDAKDLKENLDRRERVVSGILSRYLTEQQLQTYSEFVKRKTSFLIEHKDLEEQIKFHEEQLETLQKSNSYLISQK